MECFTHASAPAVATCKTCARAICRDCARDLDFAVVCGDACAAEATDLQEMNRRAKQVYGIGSAKRRLPLAPLMWAAFAILFGGFGVYEYLSRGRLEWFLLLFGLLSAILAIITYRRAKDLGLNC